MRYGFPSARRRPRPSCWVKTVALSVGRSSSTVSTLGTSTPSPRTSTEKIARSSPASSRRKRIVALGRLGDVCPTARPSRGRSRRTAAPCTPRARLKRRSRAPAFAPDPTIDPPDRLEQLCDACVVPGDDALELLARISAALPAQRRRDRCRQRRRSTGTGRGSPRRSPPTAVVRPRCARRRTSVTSCASMRSGVAVRPTSSARIEMIKEPPVARRRCVVELVDDDDVERRCGPSATRGPRRRSTGSSRTRADPPRLRPPPWISPNDPSRSTCSERRDGSARESARGERRTAARGRCRAAAAAADSRARRPPSYRCQSRLRRGSDAGRGARARPSGARASVADADTGERRARANETLGAASRSR